MRTASIAASALLIGGFLGCHKEPLSPSDLAGQYEYFSAQRAQGTICFVLRADGTYLYGDATEPLNEINQISVGRTPREGTWRLGFGTGQELQIGNSSFPIERTATRIQVTINDDLGMFCDLVGRK